MVSNRSYDFRSNEALFRKSVPEGSIVRSGMVNSAGSGSQNNIPGSNANSFSGNTASGANSSHSFDANGGLINRTTIMSTSNTNSGSNAATNNGSGNVLNGIANNKSESPFFNSHSPQQPPPATSSVILSSLATNSENLLLENEKILKMFPKCRPRTSGAEATLITSASLNQIHGNTQQLLNSNKKVISDSTPNASKSPSPTPSATNRATPIPITTTNNNVSMDYLPVVTTKVNKSGGGTNPFLNTAEPKEESLYHPHHHLQQQQYYPGKRLTQSQSDYSLLSVYTPDIPTSTVPSSAGIKMSNSASQIAQNATEIMTKNFQKHLKSSTTSSYNQNPFLKSDQVEEEDEEELSPEIREHRRAEYYYDRRSSRNQYYLNNNYHNYPYYNNNYRNTTPASTVLNSPDLNDLDGQHKDFMSGIKREENNVDYRDCKYLNVGRSPINNPVPTADQDPEDCSYLNQKISRQPTPVNPDETNSSSSTIQKDRTKSNKSSRHSNRKYNKNMAVVGGEMVIFDDIEESWYNLKVKPEPEDRAPSKLQNDKEDVIYSTHPEEHYLNINSIHNSRYRSSPAGDENVAGMVIEYDGSPRRFGNTSYDSINVPDKYSSSRYPAAQNSQYSPRPGFPQRVVNSGSNYESDNNPSPSDLVAYKTTLDVDQESDCVKESTEVEQEEASLHDLKNITSTIGLSGDNEEFSVPTSTFDYLYEFSETRKVLEEFFKCPTFELDDDVEKLAEKLSESDVESLDIHYEFRGIEMKKDSEVNKNEIDPNLNNSIEDLTVTNYVDNYKGGCSNVIDPEEANEADVEDEHDDNPPRIKNRQIAMDRCSNARESNSNDSPELQMNRPETHNGGSGSNKNGAGNLNSRYFRYSPETTDYDSNCGDLDSLSGEFNNTPVPMSQLNYQSTYMRQYYTSMPVLEDGLSSGHASDTENNNLTAGRNLNGDSNSNQILSNLNPVNEINNRNALCNNECPINSKAIEDNDNSMYNPPSPSSTPTTQTTVTSVRNSSSTPNNFLPSSDSNYFPNINTNNGTTTSSLGLVNNKDMIDLGINSNHIIANDTNTLHNNSKNPLNSNSESVSMGFGAVLRDENLNPINTNMLAKNLASNIFKNTDPELESLYSISKFHQNDIIQMTPPPPAPVPHRKPSMALPANGDVLTGNGTLNQPNLNLQHSNPNEIQGAIKDIRTTIHRTKCIPPQHMGDNINSKPSPVWLSSFGQCREDSLESTESDPLQELKNNNSGDEEEEPDTDLETDRLLGHQRSDDPGFYDEKNWLNSNKHNRSLLSKLSPKLPQTTTPSNATNTNLGNSTRLLGNSLIRQGLNSLIPNATTPDNPSTPKISSTNLMDISESISSPEHSDNNNSNRDKSNDPQSDESPGGSATSNIENDKKKKSKSKEVLIEGVLFRAKYLGSTQLVCEGQPTKSTRMMQAEEAVSRIKALAPEGDGQPSTEVDLFISTEKIMVLNTDLKEIMMDHALRTISYIADIGDLVVLMARRRFVPQDVDEPKPNRTPKMICHVFESDEAQFIAQSIGQAFQVAYMEFLKANGIEDHSFVKEMDYQEVLNSQEIFGDELEIFAKKELQKEVVVPKAKGEILGVVIVESGWGSMLPTVVIANLLSNGAAARCGQLNIGDQIIAINGLSLVGLPLSTCQTYIKNTKNQTVVKFTVVPCPPVVEVKIKRPNTKYQLGFSVQNGVICSLLRGGIAERGGVRVGHRIIEINNQSVVAVPHEKIVNLLATSVGEILMKTMPTSMFRLLTGQENPIYI